jgi:glycerate 2-kinase
VFAIAGNTDGAAELAGAMLTPDRLARAEAQGMHAKERLADNDGHGFFKALGDQIVTGSTLTNVNNFRGMLTADPGSLTGLGPAGPEGREALGDEQHIPP